MKHVLASSLTVLGFLIQFLRAAQTAGLWEQCGAGRCAWTGTTSCVSGSECVQIDQNYAHCRPLDAPAVAPIPRYYWSQKVEKAGPNFVVKQCQPFSVVGANLPMLGLAGLNDAEIDSKLDNVVAAGGTVIRGFNEVIKANTTSSSSYIQSWSDPTPTRAAYPSFNSNGLSGLDKVVKSAASRGLYVIIVLTNNWSDYGGMDVYVDRVVGPGQPHDLFYTDPRIKSIFKGYMTTIINRYIYRDEIFGYELANEPRCSGSAGVTSGACTPATITSWAAEMAAYVKGTDQFALVAIGDEGFYNEQGPSKPYQGGEVGLDFEANLALPEIDYGTFTTYPKRWGQDDGAAWGATWIEDHAESSKLNGKPVILEAVDGSQAEEAAWEAAVASSGLTGALMI